MRSLKFAQYKRWHRWAQLSSDAHLGIFYTFYSCHFVKLATESRAISTSVHLKSVAGMSRSQQSPLSSGRLLQSNVSIEEEVQIFVGNVHYVLIPHKEVVMTVEI